MTARDKRPQVSRSRPSEGEIDKCAGFGKKGRAQHAEDLRMALRSYYDYSAEPNPKLYAEGSRNMLSLRLAVRAEQSPSYAAQIIIKELDAEHQSLENRNRRRFWGDDELLSSIYESWTTFGRLLTLKWIERAGNYEGTAGAAAIELLRTDLARSQALYALLAVPGVVRNQAGAVVYRGPCVRSAGLRSLLSRVANPSTTPVASALLGGGEWLRPMDPLEGAMHELAAELGVAFDGAQAMDGLWRPHSNHQFTDRGVAWAKHVLAGTRTIMEFEIRHYADGTRESFLLGPKGNSSTAEIRYCRVSGPEATDCVAISPHGEDERRVGPSDAWISDSGELWISNVLRQIPLRSDWTLRVRFSPDSEPTFEVRP